MKRFLILTLLAALMTSAGCGAEQPGEGLAASTEVQTMEAAEPTEAPTPTPEPTALERVKANGVLRVAICPDYAPFEFQNEAEEIVGSDAKLANYLGNALGVAVTFVPVELFTDVLVAVDDGRADVAISCIADTAERRAAYALSDQYGGDAIETAGTPEPQTTPSASPEGSASPEPTEVVPAQKVEMENGMVVAAKAGDATLIDEINGQLAVINRDGLYAAWLDDATMLAEKLQLLD